jgi:ketosteroid isomerase-like protein
MLVLDLASRYSKGGLMPASTPEQIHRLFEEAFNAGDLDGLMELYEPDAALIAQPGSLANGSEQTRAALQGFLALKGRITLDTKVVVTVGDLAYLANTWSLTGTGQTVTPLCLALRRPSGAAPGRRQLALCDRQRLGRSGGHRMTTGARPSPTVAVLCVVAGSGCVERWLDDGGARATRRG